jgi:hypothetical protein
VVPQDFLGMDARKDDAAERCQDGRVNFHDGEMQKYGFERKRRITIFTQRLELSTASLFTVFNIEMLRDKER